MSKTLQTRIQLKHDTLANWEIAGNNGFVPLAGEIILVEDPDHPENAPLMIVGDGETNISELPIASMPPTYTEYYSDEEWEGTSVYPGNIEVHNQNSYSGINPNYITVITNEEDGNTTMSTLNDTYVAAGKNYGTDYSTSATLYSEGYAEFITEGNITKIESNGININGCQISKNPNSKQLNINGDVDYVSFDFNRLIAVGHPVTDTDAATKWYVDNAIPVFTVAGTTLVVGSATTIPAAEDYSF